ncbi:MAG: zinc dependent phospholipase C family protein [Spirochaetales bacterium]|nr:zinc dependent phospholipase C family protein [Spirochaetales bacterium]
MPGYVLHLYVGNELAKTLANQRDLFIAGNLAPDAAHARKPYDREHKKASHLKQGFRDRQLTDKKNQIRFEQGIKDFISQIQFIDNPGKKEFYYGYIAHVLTDYFFIQNILDDIYEECAAQKYHSDESLVTGGDFTEEYTAMDGAVLAQFYELDDVLEKLENSHAFDVESLVFEHEVLKARAWTLKQIRGEKDFNKELKYLNKKDLFSLLESCLDYVRSYLDREMKRESNICLRQ